MKALLTVLSFAAILAALITTTGNPFDAATGLALAFASSLAGLGAADYGRKPDYRTPAARAAAPARHVIRRPRTSAGFASVIVFETTCI